MCARYTMRTPAEQIQTLFELTDEPEIEIRPHAAPTDVMPIIRLSRDGKRRVHPMRWGLIPHWAKDATIARQTFNARSETVFEKPTFRESILRRRCLVPADGFIEWKEVPDPLAGADDPLGGLFDTESQTLPSEPKRRGSRPKKQPFHIHLKDGRPFAFAGLYDRWSGPEGQPIETFTILTCPPNELMADIHNRMPVILHPEDYATWLDRDNQNPAVIMPLMVPFEADAMEAVPA